MTDIVRNLIMCKCEEKRVLMGVLDNKCMSFLKLMR